MKRSRRWWAAALVAAGGLGVGLALGLSGSGSPRPGTSAAAPSATSTGSSALPAPVPAPGPPAQPAPSAQALGANVNRVFQDPAFAPRIDAQIAALQATDAAIARCDALWELTEPDPPSHGVHHYRWSYDDRVAGALAAHRLRWLALLDYSPSWAQSTRGQEHSPPASDADFAAYAESFAARYGPHGSFWSAHPELPAEPVQTIEVWNEPDNPTFWAPHPDAAAYAKLYVSARDAIAAVAPGIRVVVGGLTHWKSFLPAILHAEPGLAGHLDGVAIHPYARSPEKVFARIGGARAVLDQLGLSGVPLYVTEFGWTTSPPGAHAYLPEPQRPGYIELTVAGLGHLQCGIAAATLYTWVTSERDPSKSEQWYGIHPPAGGTSPDVQAFAAGLRVAAGSGSPIACSG